MLIQRYLALMIAFLCLAHSFRLHAEIEQITLKWTPGLCQSSCMRSLEQQFKNIKGVVNTHLNGPLGQGDLTWDPNTAFSYRSIEMAMALIGLGINDIRLRVKGNITHDERNIILISSSDHTHFFLLNNISIVPNQYVEENSAFNRLLTPQTRTQLLNAERNQQTVTISGPLFQPENSPPLFLVIDSLSITEKAE